MKPYHHLSFDEPLIFELSKEGREGIKLPEDKELPDYNLEELFDKTLLREREPELPEVSEPQVIRHFTRLSSLNFSIDHGFYPLGSCTMKYNPKINEKLSMIEEFLLAHPYAPEELVQGALELMYELEQILCEIGGFSRVSLQPSAGAQGELTGIAIIRAYHESKGNPRSKILIPDTAHGTNPASTTLNGYKVVEIKSGPDGILEPEEVEKHMDEETAGIMITNPNTLGLFEKNLLQIAEIVHSKGGLVYGDGANLNALMGRCKPKDLGIDCLQFNLHKTFSTPHGGGGPGSGPLGVVEELVPFLPVPTVERREDGTFYLDYDRPKSIGRVRSFFGNFGVLIKAYIYLKQMGRDGLKKVTDMAVLNANYIKEKLKGIYHLPYDRRCMHEVVFSDKFHNKNYGVTTMDIAKRLIDYGIHPPTIYFPLIVKGALMIEPTETESKETLDRFIEVMKRIDEEAKSEPELLKKAPWMTKVKRLDEVRAARKPILRWRKGERDE